MNHRITTTLAALGCVLACPAGRSAETDGLSVYYTNTVLCQNTVTKAICRLFLEPDGTYEVFYYYGRREKMPEADGPFEQEGRDGRYSVRHSGGTQQICLKPNAVGVKLQMESLHVLYGEATCYALAPRKVGDRWQQRVGADRYDLWVLEGR